VRPSPLYLCIGLVSWPVLYGVFRLRARGLEAIPRNGGFVLAANHTSNLDPWPLGMPLWPERQLRFMAKSELYWWPLRYLLAAGGTFPVRRGERDVEAIETAVRLAREGHVIAMFPEGTRRQKGLVKRYEARPHTGAARIAIEAEVPLVPAAISGTERLSRLGPLRIAYGRPLDPGDDPHAATERLMEEIYRLHATL
jgi:1-acyl-sn-glycerol-3-phosphate acyltransferase